jgi:glutaredoxin
MAAGREAGETLTAKHPAQVTGAEQPAGEQPATLLYRCPTPTNWLCPCGAVERRLRRLGVEHRTVRLPYRRTERPEIEELTRQRRLPVLVDGDEVIHDSKRILQYLDWKHGSDTPSTSRAST